MTFYRDEVTRLSKVLYPHNDLTKQIMESRHYIDKHFSEDINLDKIAGKALVSKFHFIRVFKRYYGRTPNQYLQEVRIEMAKKILLKRKNIDEVCNEIGFKSKTSFISLFKKMTGITPLAYQNKKSNFE
ncbi:MAG: helix-turn-helix transcriptional regulator [Bacteroidetes bacterium]|jgi:AraC-like DNA-binding protein|nr:MAG: helix-turn-helix transcriptional regulator [Bacteroidota bacterium]